MRGCVSNRFRTNLYYTYIYYKGEGNNLFTRLSMKKIFSKTVSVRFLTFALLAALLLGVALLLRLGLYSVPWYDDYEYAKYTKSFQEAYGSGLINAIRGACYQVRESWVIWQGTFSSIFLMALSPMGFNTDNYYMGSFVLIILLTVSAAVLTFALCRRVFGIKGYPAVCLSFAMSIFTVWRVYSANQAFYWYNGGLHYVGMHSFMMLFVAVLICMMDLRKPATTALKVILSVILAVICSGANFTTSLQGILLLTGITVLTLVKQKKKALVYVPAIMVYLIGFAFNVLAPGNSMRAAYYTDTAMSAPKAILYSFVEAFKRMWDFTGIFTIVFMIALVPIIWKGLENSTFNFKLPLIFVVLAFCFYATSYTAPLYGTGQVVLDRAVNAAKLTYQFMLVVCEIYAVGWIKKKTAAGKSDIGYAWLYAACLIVLAVAFAVSPAERIKYSPYGAYYYVHTGEAAAYHDGYLRQIESIKSQGPDAVVDRNVFKPAYLYTDELSDDSAYEANRFMANWYGKNSIAVRMDETSD